MSLQAIRMPGKRSIKSDSITHLLLFRRLEALIFLRSSSPAQEDGAFFGIPYKSTLRLIFQRSQRFGKLPVIANYCPLLPFITRKVTRQNLTPLHGESRLIFQLKKGSGLLRSRGVLLTRVTHFLRQPSPASQGSRCRSRYSR